MNRLLTELKRRNVLRAAALYAAAAWVLVQVATQVFPFFDIPNWAVRLVVVAAIVGFPFALVISWFFELTPAGFRRETEPGQPAAATSIWRNPAFRLALLSAAAVAAALLIAAGLVSRRTEPVRSDASVAVLPFRNLSTEADNAYFVEGVQDEILTHLTRIAALRVVSHNSSARYPSAPDDLSKVAHELGVENLLEGSVQRQGDAVRINVRLVRAAGGVDLWSESYDRKLTDIFGVESEVAKAVAASLKATLSGTERRELDSLPTTNTQAYDQYLRGLALNLRSFDTASRLGSAGFLRRAVELDPGFAEAWALLAQTDAYLADQLADTPGQCDRAGREAAAALRLKPELGGAHLARGYYLYFCTSDLEGAQAAFEQARLRLPGDSSVMEAIGNLARRRGDLDQTLDDLRQAIASDPRNAELLGGEALTLVELRRFDEAYAAAERALDVVPDDPAMLGLQAYTRQAQGQLGQAQRLLDLLQARPQDAGAFDYRILQLLYLRQPAEAASQLRQALAQDLGPAGIGAIDYWYLLGVALRAGGDVAAARRAFADGRAQLGRFAAAVQSPDARLYRDALLCLTDTGSGDEAAAQRDCAGVAAAAGAGGLDAPGAHEVLARAAALRGDAAAVAAALPELLRAHYFSYLYSAPLTPALLRQDPLWDGVRADPRFKALAEAGG